MAFCKIFYIKGLKVINSMIYRKAHIYFRNVHIRNKNLDPDESKPSTVGTDAELKELLNEVAPKFTPAAVSILPTKATVKTKSLEFSARVMGIPPPDNSSQVKGWTEHPIIRLGREEVNARFADMPQNQDSEKRLGCPLPAQPNKLLTTVAAETLAGTEMHKLPHSLRSEIPMGAKIETVDPKAKLPKQVEDEAPGVLWNAVRNNFY